MKKLRWPNEFMEFSAAGIRRMVSFALACLASGLFIKLTWELGEDSDLSQFDEMVLICVGKMRLAALNGPAVDVTALGSATLAFLVCLTGVIVLWLVRNRREAIFLVLSVVGAGVGSATIKSLIQRPRPAVIPPLVEVTDFSYPSGHTIISTATFLAIALLTSRHFTAWSARLILFTMAAMLIGLVGLSRVYLGVHYPSDVLSGILLGAAWTLGLAAMFFSQSKGERSPS